MQLQETTRNPLEMRNTAQPGRIWTTFQTTLVALAAAILTTGCVGLPTPTEQSAIVAGKKSLVLLRIEATVRGRPFKPFAGIMVVDNITLAIGTFRTAGKPEPVRLRFLSSKSKKEGWTYFVLEPGTYYLAVRPPQSTDAATYDNLWKTAPRWRMDLPANAPAVYVGTMHLAGDGRWVMFGSRSLESILSSEINTDRDRYLASELLANGCPNVGNMQVVPLKEHRGGPIILHSPLPTP